MKTFNMTVTDKVLVREETEEVIICGNGDYEIKFTFDTEWNSHAKKTARFTYNGEHHDVEFSGNICNIPMIVNASVVGVGVYAGEEGASEKPRATTKVSILCVEGSRCGDSAPSPATGENYTNEARGYAAEAKAAMENIEQYKGLEEIGKFVWSGEFYTEPCYSDGSGEETGYRYFAKHTVDSTFISLLKQARFAHVHLRGEYADFNGIITIGTVHHSGYHGIYHTDFGKYACFGLTVLTQPDPNGDDYDTDLVEYVVCSKEFAQMAGTASSKEELVFTFYR